MAAASERHDHVFQTTLAPETFEAVVARSCRAAFAITVEARDPTLVPPLRLVNVSFASVEDRDRVRIAMRFAEKDLIDAARAREKTPPRAAARLARA
jgi:hypothetical protein